MRYRRNVKYFTGQLDVAPFASVLLLLVIFLMLHSYLAPPPGIRIQLPTATAASSPGPTNPDLVVAVDREGQIYFEHQALQEKELRARLAAKVRQTRGPLTLLVQADAAVKLDVLARLGAVASAAGVREARFETRPPLFPLRRRPGEPP